MSSCEGAGTFWAGKNVDAAVQGFLQSRLFPQIPARSAGPPLVPMAIKSLGEGCGLKVIHVSLQGNSSTQRIAEEQRERGGTPGSWGDTEVLGSPGTLVQGAGPKATLHGIVGGVRPSAPLQIMAANPSVRQCLRECVEEPKGFGKAPVSLNTWAGPPRCVLYPLLGRDTMFLIPGSFSPADCDKLFLCPQPSVPQGRPVSGGQRLFVLSLGSISCP